MGKGRARWLTYSGLFWASVLPCLLQCVVNCSNLNEV
jgi:hypothetical protein